MNKIAKFSKVSYKQFKEDFVNNNLNYSMKILTEEKIKEIYDSIKLPQRATSGSAGYDFYIPFDTLIFENEDINIPTGIRCEIENGWVLQIYPRSGQGFKTGVHLANTVGIIDSDYYNSDNEGHIFVKLVNDSLLTKEIKLKQGNAFCQGVFVPFGITTDDNVDKVRNGGFGSTTNI